MHQAISFLLTSALILQAVPTSAQEPSQTLGERIHNMDAEVERFVTLYPAASDCRVSRQETSAKDESANTLRAKLQMLEPGTRVGVILQDGEKVQGQLAEVTDGAFFLNVEIEERRYRRREIHFDQVVSLEHEGLSEKVYKIPIDKRIEVMLFDGEKVRGRLSNITAQGFTLDLGKDANREFTFDEVASVRELGMRTVNKILIGFGIFWGVMLIGYLGALAQG